MVTIGVNTFLWTTTWTDGVGAILENAKRIGFDAVQVPLIGLGQLDAEDLARVTQSLGLACYVSAGLNDATDITSDDPDIRRNGVRYLKECVRFARQAGAPFLSGSFHSVFGKKSDRPVGSQQWRRSADALREVAREALEQDFCLALEPINRYESFLVNTADQARTLIEMIGQPNVKIQLDTFHMNIEEDDCYRAVTSVGEDLLHFHVAENHRGRFGAGSMPWDDIFRALAEIGYRGAIVIESFVPDVPEVATAAAIWRKMAPSADALAEEGLAFIRALEAKHRL